jgi:bifunctional DNase/RNase
MERSQRRSRRLQAVFAVLVLALVVLGGWLVWVMARAGTPGDETQVMVADRTLSPTAHEMAVVDLVRERSGPGVVLVLQERGRGRFLLLTIGSAEALAIAMPLQGEAAPRPLSHDLMARMLGELRAQVVRVVVTDLRESTYYAQLVLRVDGREIELDSRPSDAVAIALRTQAPIYAEADVLERAALTTERPF